MRGALDGVRVIELCQVMAGPFCGQVLGDMGADVIKVEPPETGDQTRVGMGEHAFRAVNRNKRSITLDLKDPGDIAILHRLVETADVLTENFRPGVATRLSADYETLRAINPRLIYASISGFGQTGPYAQRPGLRPDRPGRGGRDERHRRARRQPGQGGRPGQRSLAPACSARSASSPRCTAAPRTGEGQRIDTSLWEGALALGDLGDGRAVGDRQAAAAARLRAPPDRALPGAADQGRPRHGRRQQPEAVAAAVRDDRARGPPGRPALRHQRRPYGQPPGSSSPSSSRRSPRATTAEWVDALLEAGVPAGPILDYAQVVADPHTRAREMVVEMEHPEAGTVRALGIPVKLSATPGTIRRPAPLLGQHSDEIRAELDADG